MGNRAPHNSAESVDPTECDRSYDSNGSYDKKDMSDLHSDIKYLNLVQTDINKFNESQEKKREEYKKKNGESAYYKEMHAKKHNSLKESRSVDYSLTNEELEILKVKGYIVKHIKNNNKTFAHKILELYNNDMPIIITSDMMLHAFHKYYDETIKQLEVSMYHKLVKLCKELCNTMSSLKSDNNLVNKIIEEIKPLFEMPVHITDCAREKVYAEEMEKIKTKYVLSDEVKLRRLNYALRDEGFSEISKIGGLKIMDVCSDTRLLLQKIEKYEDVEMDVNSIEIKMMGTLFKPRGHYVKSKMLERYFKIFTLFSSFTIKYMDRNFPLTDENYDNAIMVSSIISRICKQSLPLVETFYNFIEKMIGKPDGFNAKSFNDFLDTIIPNGMSLSEELEYITENPHEIRIQFEQYLNEKFNDPSLKERNALFSIIRKGFSWDNYAILNMIDYKFVDDNGYVPKRKFPDIMDIMYCTFDNYYAYENLLETGMNEYQYTNHLNKVKNEVNKLVETDRPKTIYEQQTILLRSLGKDKKLLQEKGWWPFYTADWNKKQLNTQLGHYCEMRHDNVLYVDEVCGMCCLCRYPDLMVEPVPSFWREFLKLIDIMQDMLPKDKCLETYKKYIGQFIEFLDFQLDGKHPPEELVESLKSNMAVRHMGSGGDSYLGGWYISLFKSSDDAEKYSPEVSSFFTAPDDDRGKGGILNLGTGEVQTLYVLADDPITHEKKIFLGPVYSSYSFQTNYDDRLNDEDWKKRIGNCRPFDCN